MKIKPSLLSRWRDAALFGVGESFRDNRGARRITAVAAVGLIAISVMFIGYRLLFPPNATPSPPREAMTYFFDMNTKEVFTVPASTLGPIETASGPHEGLPAGVRAHVYACESCDDPDQRFVGWLEIPIEALARLNPEKYEELSRRDPAKGEIATTLVKRPDDEQWFAADSPRARRIIHGVSSDCGGNTPYRCQPSSRPMQ